VRPRWAPALAAGALVAAAWPTAAGALLGAALLAAWDRAAPALASPLGAAAPPRAPPPPGVAADRALDGRAVGARGALGALLSAAPPVGFAWAVRAHNPDLAPGTAAAVARLGAGSASRSPSRRWPGRCWRAARRGRGPARCRGARARACSATRRASPCRRWRRPRRRRRCSGATRGRARWRRCWGGARRRGGAARRRERGRTGAAGEPALLGAAAAALVAARPRSPWRRRRRRRCWRGARRPASARTPAPPAGTSCGTTSPATRCG
jgi:hypothetical protein